MMELADTTKGVETAAGLIEDSDPNSYYVACGLARAGELDLALDCLERIVEAGWYDANWLTYDQDLDALRDEPRFKRIAKELSAA